MYHRTPFVIVFVMASMLLASSLVSPVHAVAVDGAGIAGAVLTVDRDAGRIVVGDMGPLLASGSSELSRRSIRVTPSTEFVMVKRAAGTAPSGFVGDYVESRLAAWDVRPGDYVTVTVRPGQGDAEAIKITVVDTGQP